MAFVDDNSDNEPDETLFPEFMQPKPKPLRTYSHKRKAGKTVKLPVLRENPPAKKRALRVVVHPADLTQSSRSLQGTAEEEQDEEGSYHHDEEEDTSGGGGLDEDTEDSVLKEKPIRESIENPATKRYNRHHLSRVYSLSSSSDSDDNAASPYLSKPAASRPPISTSVTSPSRSLKRPVGRPPFSNNRTIRRRPFLIFDETVAPTRGFKKLTPPKAKPERTQPGDGFSDGEAKFEGFGKILGKRRAPPSALSGAELDLTQTKGELVEKEREKKKRKKRVEDNAFDVPVAKGKEKKTLKKYVFEKSEKAAGDGTGELVNIGKAEVDDNASAPCSEKLPTIVLEGDVSSWKEGHVLRNTAADTTTKDGENQTKTNGKKDANSEPSNAVLVTVPFDSRQVVIPRTDSPDQPPTEAGSTATWETFIEESSPFRRISSSEEPLQLPDKQVIMPVRAARAFRRARSL